MSRLFSHTIVAGFAAVLVASSMIPAHAQVGAQGIERSYSFGTGKKSAQKKKAAPTRSFNLFDIFSNPDRTKNPNSRQLQETRQRAVKKIRRKVRIRTYVYRAEPLINLGNSKLKQPANQNQPELSGKLDDSLAQTIFDTLASGNLSTKVTAKQNKAIVAYYKSRNFKPLWTEMDGVLSTGKLLLAYLAQADDEGMTSADYLPAGLSGFSDNLADVESDLEALAQLDINLTAMAVRYGQNASGGKIIPNRLSSYHDLAPPKVSAGKILKAITASDRPETYLASLHPTHKSYQAFKQALADLNDQAPQKQYARLPAGRLIKLRGSDPRLVAIRERLTDNGLLAVPDVSQQRPDYYDEALFMAVKTFQKSKDLPADGIIGRQTIAAFNGTSNVSKAKKLVMNMERLRWLPRNFGRKYIFVNPASFKMQVMENGAQIWETRVVVGKPQNQTNFFIDEMEIVVFNPYWGVPQSIIANEMLPRLQSNPGYLDQKGFELYNRRGKKIRSSSVDWYKYGGNGVPFSVRQPPGNNNALGKIKFMFPNKHAIYLHDTPSKNLFNRSSRAFSHGCVRVKNPRKFAETVLGWSRSKIDSSIASGKNRAIRLKRKIPVYLTYFTAWADQNGNINYYNDVYRRDRLLDRALNLIKIASK